MLEMIKKNYLNILIAFFYVVVASLVYGIWSYSAWHLWYVTFIIILVIISGGIVIGYFWIKNENRKKLEKTGIDKDENNAIIENNPN